MSAVEYSAIRPQLSWGRVMVLACWLDGQPATQK